MLGNGIPCPDVFPSLIRAATQYCGNLLLDVGIPQMYLNPSTTPIPAAAATIGSDGYLYVPAGTRMTVAVGTSGGTSPMSYTVSIPYTGPAPTPTAARTDEAPVYAQWAGTTPPSANFINTGRDPIIDYNYFYDAQCGQAGFQQLPRKASSRPAPSGSGRGLSPRDDRDARLLAGVRDIGDGRAMHIAGQRRSSNSVPRCIVQRSSHITRSCDAPSMRVDELALRRVRDELVDQRAAFASDMPSMRPMCDAM